MNQTDLDKCLEQMLRERINYIKITKPSELQRLTVFELEEILTLAKNCLDPPRVASVLPIRTLECKDEDENK